MQQKHFFHTTQKLSQNLVFIVLVSLTFSTTPTYATEATEQPGILAKLSSNIQSGLQKIFSLFASRDEDNGIQSNDAKTVMDVKSSLKNDAKVPDTLYVEYVGPKSNKPVEKKHEVSIEEIEKELAPLPTPEIINTTQEPTKVKDALQKQHQLDSIQTDANIAEDLHKKSLSNVPTVPVSNSLALEEEVADQKSAKTFAEQNNIHN